MPVTGELPKRIRPQPVNKGQSEDAERQTEHDAAPELMRQRKVITSQVASACSQFQQGGAEQELLPGMEKKL
jgi:hypothetical protein